MTAHSIRERIIVNGKNDSRSDDNLRRPIHARIVARMDTVGDRLNELMQAHPLYSGSRGQSALSRASGVPQPTISRTLKGQATPEIGTIAKLANVFGVAIEWLTSGRGPKYVATVDVHQGTVLIEEPELLMHELNAMVHGLKHAPGKRPFSPAAIALARAALEADIVGLPPKQLEAIARILDVVIDAHKASLSANRKIEKIAADAELPSDQEVLAAIAGLGIGRNERAESDETHEKRNRRRKGS